MTAPPRALEPQDYWSQAPAFAPHLRPRRKLPLTGLLPYFNTLKKKLNLFNDVRFSEAYTPLLAPHSYPLFQAGPQSERPLQER